MSSRADRGAGSPIVVGLLAALALALAAAAPLLFFVSGASDSATTGASLRLAAVPLALMWLPLSPAIGMALRRRGRRAPLFGVQAGLRALLLVLWACAVACEAYWMGWVIHGDLAWTSFWAAALAGLVAAGVAAVRHGGSWGAGAARLLAVTAIGLGLVPAHFTGDDGCNHYSGTAPLIALLTSRQEAIDEPPPLAYRLSITEMACPSAR